MSGTKKPHDKFDNLIIVVVKALLTQSLFLTCRYNRSLALWQGIFKRNVDEHRRILGVFEERKQVLTLNQKAGQGNCLTFTREFPGLFIINYTLEVYILIYLLH
ncbi:MAG: hypothetical protein LBU02_03035 [Rickettsiales bacterium]|jgi:hypothetical protein|nr:hypothetical protein [Rickettsiales bacterium]